MTTRTTNQQLTIDNSQLLNNPITHLFYRAVVSHQVEGKNIHFENCFKKQQISRFLNHNIKVL